MDYGGEVLGGGALALLVIREVLNFLKSKRNENGHPKEQRVADQTVEAWRNNAATLIRQEVPPLVSQVIKQEAIPLISSALAILNEQQKTTQGVSQAIVLLTRLSEMQLGEVKELHASIRDEGDMTRHAVRDQGKETVQNIQRNIDQIGK